VATGQVKTVRSNAGCAWFAADHGTVFVDPEDVYEQVFAFFDKVGAAYAGAHERLATHLDEYQAWLASGYDCLTRAAYAQMDFVNAVASARADLNREMAKACDSALRDMLLTAQMPDVRTRD
jgi:hypothetical protein